MGLDNLFFFSFSQEHAVEEDQEGREERHRVGNGREVLSFIPITIHCRWWRVGFPGKSSISWKSCL